MLGKVIILLTMLFQSINPNEVSNFVYSIVETIRPIMLDGNPGIQATARNPLGD